MEADEALAVVRALASEGISCGVSGGWGVDALLDRQTRPHRDIDVAVDASAIEQAIQALGALGYRLTVDQRPARLEFSAPYGRIVDLHPVRWEADGTGYQQGFDSQVFVYPPGSMNSIGHIGGAEVRCASPELQMSFHAGYEHQPHDRHDVEALAAAFGLELPPAYASGGNSLPSP
jgi:lincosamide nucleotidyltransferase A/C/D/E